MTKQQAIAAAQKASSVYADYCFACKFKDGWRLMNWPAGKENVRFYMGVQV